MRESDDNYPIIKMMDAAKKAKSNEDAVWAALSTLEKAGGYIILPLRNDGSGWRPSIPHLKRRTARRLRS